jgi:metal-responsive CopG/Arc/MetJ family transcriptional regulator
LTAEAPTRYASVVKIETTVALSEDIVSALDSRSHDLQDRSEIVEAALRAYLAWPRDGEDAGDLEIINSRSAELNEEAADVLEYQVIP